MSAPLRLTGHTKDLGGGFMVRRLLPAAQRRSVGPFIFFDHFGPVTEVPEANHDVRPHPHIGLATVTYLFEGAMMHRDSLGSVQQIEPGAINWMTAGRGIVHSERKPQSLAGRSFVNHGLQLWVALPQAFEEVAPSFTHTPAEAIPQTVVGAATVRVLIGSAFGHSSPVATLAPTLYLDIRLPAGAQIELPALADEMALYPVSGDARVDDEPLAQHTLQVLADGAGAQISAGDTPVQLVVIGGATLDGPRHMWWNFVSSRKERIVQAADDWEAGRFDAVDGETEFIPLPPRHFT
ncbi:MAG: pirin family protein [Ramlibacter sp.]|nr:pirin family protein [Ramlibacter sp.]